MRLNKIFSVISAVLVCALFFTACESTELDLSQDPNFLSPDQADPDFFLNAIQEDFAKLVDELGEETQEVTRILQMGSRNYQNAYAPTGFDVEWEDAYQQILLDIRTMNEAAIASELYTHVAITQIIEAYTMVMLVDFFGDVPYSEALQGADGVFTPTLDAGSTIYDAALVLLDGALANLALEEAAQPAQDLFFGGSTDPDDNWARVANTMKMKIYLNRRLVDGGAVASFFNIVDNQPYISSTAEDFEFQYGTSQNNPDTRHPHYVDHYTPSGVGAGYMSNWLMDLMLQGKVGNASATFEAADPRMLYYFHRQSSEVPVDEQLIRCSVEAAPQHYIDGDEVYCRLPDGYWGRDHGDDGGIPPDTQSRAAYGVYPVGGLYDDGSFSIINDVAMGGNGAGITPIFLSSGVDFMIAEMELMRGNDAAALSLIQGAIYKSFDKVRSFKDLDPVGAALDGPTRALDTAYVAEVGELYNAANADGKMNLLAKELFVVLFGNGLEAYNFYRRTGQPNDIQPNIEPNPGSFIRSFPYPANAANRNNNFPQNKQVSEQVFWDTNPANFVD